MNNDINGTSLSSSVASCSSYSTTTNTAPCNVIAGSGVNGGGSGGSSAANDTSITSFSSKGSFSTNTANNFTASQSINTSATIGDQAIGTTGTIHNEPNESGSWEERLIKDWDYCHYKQLLDEAYSYKNPRDKENKSKTFLQLLEIAENEKEDQKFAFRALTSLYTTRNSTSNTQKQGGSLQDLFEAVRNESIDCDYNYGGSRNRRHNHNSRPKKYSSVSSRQREGGSLPSNVNVSNCSLSVYDQPFLNEEPAQQSQDQKESRILPNAASVAPCLRSVNTLPAKTPSSGISTTATTGSNFGFAEVTISTKACTGTTKNDFAVGGGCSGICEPPKGVKGIKNTISLAAIGSATSATCAALATATAVVSGSTDTVVEMNENYIDQHNDVLSQGIQFDRFDGIEMKIPRANIIGSVLTRSDSSPNNTYVDEAVHFTTLERGKSTVDASYTPLDENYKACKSVLGEKSELVKVESFSTSKTISKQYDENGNSHNTTFTVNPSQTKVKKKKTQSERNTKTLDVQSVEGYRGSDPIEELVKYIESSEDTKQNEKVNKFSESRKKDKRRDKDKDKEKEKSKIKRSNSLEEFTTCSKMDGDEVTMRNKNNIKNKNIDSKEKQIAPSSIAGGSTGTSRKGERRSWGTEELTYWGENNLIEEVRDRNKEKEKKKSKEKDLGEKLEKVVEKRKKTDNNLVVSMESISCESAEFHVVTKKKKPKKQRQLTEENRNNNSSIPHKSSMYHNRKYHSNFSNERDVYISSFNNNSNKDKTRRKSTSSMPPSEKSDSSDLDSVHSLPIETAGGRSPLQVHHHHNQPRSYAEIARKTDATAPVVGAPTATAATDSTASNTSSNNSSHTELEVNVTSLTPVVTKKIKKTLKTDFPELISSEVVCTIASSAINNTPNSGSTTQKQISYSQSLTSAAGSKTDDFSSENTLQKSMAAEVIVKTNEKQIQKFFQPGHQVLLQKSKSVETDGFCNSIEQYPALEKTVKRHSNTNACASDISGVSALTPPSGTVSNQLNTNANSTSFGNNTPFNNKKSKTGYKPGEEVIGEHLNTTLTTKKSKREKLSNNEHFFSITQSSTTTTLTTSLSSSTTSSLNANNKNQFKHNHHNNYNNKTSCSNSHNNNTYKSSNLSNSYNNKYSNRPAVIILNDDSSSIGNEFTFGDFNEDELRLFDDSQLLSQKSKGTEVFYKRSFDDSGGNFNITGCSTASDVTNNSEDAIILMQNTSSPNSSMVIDQSSDSGICNNFDVVKGNRLNQQNPGTVVASSRSFSTDALINNNVYLSTSTSPSKESLSSSASSSSSTSSNSSASSGTYVLNAPASKAITLSTSKSSKFKITTLSYSNYNQKKNNVESRTNKNIKVITNNAKVSTNNRRNSQQLEEQIGCTGSRISLNRTVSGGVSSASSSNTTTTILPSLETCDDIETAIIAAAKKAAAVSAEQTSTSVINKNSTTKSTNSTNNNLSTSISESNTTVSINNMNSGNKLSNFNHSISCNRQNIINSSPSLTSLLSKNNECIRGGGNSGSTSSSVNSRTEAIVEQIEKQQKQQRKEIDVHFIQPTLATPTSSVQNNETIINFIGSAWEEVANSKVTQFYDGQ